MARRSPQKDAAATVPDVLPYCLDLSRDVALSASSHLLDLAQQGVLLELASVLPVLAEARVLGVRHNFLRAVATVVDNDGEATEAEMRALFRAVGSESAPELVQPFYKTLERWIATRNDVPDDLAADILDATDRLAESVRHGGIIKSAFVTLKILANLERASLSARLADSARSLLRARNINRIVDTSFVIGLLVKLERQRVGFLEEMVWQDCAIGEGALPFSNQCAVVVAVRYVRGKDALLLDEILRSDRFSDELKNRVLRERGL